MTRKELALQYSYNRWNGSRIETQSGYGMWSECCPLFIDCGNDDCDSNTEFKTDKGFGCRGITCAECWNKVV